MADDRICYHLPSDDRLDGDGVGDVCVGDDCTPLTPLRGGSDASIPCRDAPMPGQGLSEPTTPVPAVDETARWAARAAPAPTPLPREPRLPAVTDGNHRLPYSYSDSYSDSYLDSRGGVGGSAPHAPAAAHEEPAAVGAGADRGARTVSTRVLAAPEGRNAPRVGRNRGGSETALLAPLRAFCAFVGATARQNAR
jgi:hypothetical protein